MSILGEQLCALDISRYCLYGYLIVSYVTHLNGRWTTWMTFPENTSRRIGMEARSPTFLKRHFLGKSHSGSTTTIEMYVLPMIQSNTRTSTRNIQLYYLGCIIALQSPRIGMRHTTHVAHISLHLTCPNLRATTTVSYKLKLKLTNY